MPALHFAWKVEDHPMNQENHQIPQFSLILRLLCGGYLLYTAWGLRGAFGESPWYIAFAGIFAVIGLVLCVHSAVKLVKKKYTANKPLFSSEDTENTDDEEQSDE